MTAQFCEILHVDGADRILHTEPLEDYLEIDGRRHLLGPLEVHSACWRGYIGHWSIDNGRLYLTMIATISGHTIPLQVLFGDLPTPIPATWYTGQLKSPEGEIIDYVHGGFGTKYERDVFFEIRDGIVEAVNTVDNRPAAAPH